MYQLNHPDLLRRYVDAHLEDLRRAAGQSRLRHQLRERQRPRRRS